MSLWFHGTQCRAQGIYPAAYYPHNIHFLFATPAMEGRSRDALEAARRVSTRHGPEHFQEPGFGFPYLLRSIPFFAMVRFGQWMVAARAGGEPEGTGENR